jgi:hypothetical protein
MKQNYFYLISLIKKKLIIQLTHVIMNIQHALNKIYIKLIIKIKYIISLQDRLFLKIFTILLKQIDILWCLRLKIN